MKSRISKRTPRTGPGAILPMGRGPVINITRALGILLMLVSFSAHARVQLEIQAGDTDALIAAIEQANSNPLEAHDIYVTRGPNGETEFRLNAPLPDIRSPVAIFKKWDGGPKITFRPADGASHEFRLVTVDDVGQLAFYSCNIRDFGAAGAGGAVLVKGSFWSWDCRYSDNRSGNSGGAIAALGVGFMGVTNTEFSGNEAARGGALAIEDNAHGLVERVTFEGGNAFLSSCDIYLNSEHQNFSVGLRINDSVFSSACGKPLVKSRKGTIKASGNSFYTDEGATLESSDGVTAQLLGNLLVGGDEIQDPTSKGSIQKVVCEDDGGGLESLGYNISPDDSCNLDHPTDLPNTDPLVEENDDGIPIPQPGSPAIDAGAVEAVVVGDEDFASLPCGYVDVLGTARPQDGNGDGVFECDMGAIEIPGSGEITAGHSGAFFNVDRPGEGTFVEILNDELAVVYTFTYRPDASGAAWTVGVGTINGNGIVIDELLRPIGTSFGNGFFAEDIEFTPIGGMSVVFSDCQAEDPPGNVAYSDDVELGYEGLITSATRLSHITGCGGAKMASPKAGLSGSYSDSTRNGEGIIVQWLTTGEVLVVFFTYDQNGNQLWLVGIGTPDGNTVTMDVQYPSAFTSWGRDFDPDEITMSSWGTFTLTWTECDAVTFEYDSTVQGFGSATRDYSRISKLQNTDCPAF